MLDIVYIEDLEVGGFTAFSPSISWTVAEGDTKEEAREHLLEMIELVQSILN